MIAAATSASAIAAARVLEGCALSICEPFRNRGGACGVRWQGSNDAPRRPPDLVSGGAPRCPTRRTSRRRIRWSAARRRAPAFGRNIRTGAPSLWSARRAPRLRTSTSRSAWETGEKGGAGGRRGEGAAPRLLDAAGRPPHQLSLGEQHLLWTKAHRLRLPRFLVPLDLTVGQLCYVIRKRIKCVIAPRGCSPPLTRSPPGSSLQARSSSSQRASFRPPESCSPRCGASRRTRTAFCTSPTAGRPLSEDERHDHHSAAVHCRILARVHQSVATHHISAPAFCSGGGSS